MDLIPFANAYSSQKSNDTGAIVGGVIGGLVALVSLGGLLFFFYRRDTDTDSEPGRIDLILGEEPKPQPPTIEPGFYRSEPFVVPDPTSTAEPPLTEADMSNGHRISTIARSSASLPPGAMPPYDMSRRESQLSMGQLTQTSDPVSSSNGTGLRTRTGRDSKAHPPSSMRAVNIVQHTDAGVLSSEEEPPRAEVVELPPTYSEVPKPKRSPDGNEPTGNA